jgi:hypothetical protein
MGWWDQDGVDPKYPHAFQASENIPRNTGIVTAAGKPIFENPEPIGYVKPKNHQRFVTKA